MPPRRGRLLPWPILDSAWGGGKGRPERGGTHPPNGPSSHMLVVFVVKDVADEQNDGLVPEVLPPVCGAARLWSDVAGLVHDRHGAVAGVFDNLALGDVDDRGAIGMAVPRHD